MPTRAIVSRSTTGVAMATETISELTTTAMRSALKVRHCSDSLCLLLTDPKAMFRCDRLTPFCGHLSLRPGCPEGHIPADTVFRQAFFGLPTGTMFNSNRHI